MLLFLLYLIIIASDVFKDFVIKAKIQSNATVLCLRGASRPKPIPRGHITGPLL